MQLINVAVHLCIFYGIASRVGQYTDFLVILRYHFLISTRILNTEIPYLGIYSYLSDLLCIYIYIF